ncbi:MAG: phosphotransferase [Planctomycetota bacterium]
MNEDRQRFSPSELAIVLSHYDLGVIRSAREFPRGSRKSPKLLLYCASNRRYLLKRRAPHRDEPTRVSFAHTLLEHLRQHGYPVPALRETKAGQNSALQVNGATYELFEYLKGRPYEASLEQTASAGRMLARFHHAVRDFQTQWVPAVGTYHDADPVRRGLNSIPTTSASHDSVVGHEAELLTLTQELHERYDEAAEQVNREGFADWPRGIIHGDWHPGNLLFRGDRVVAVLDLDAARYQPLAIDIANGMLQFSILRGRSRPANWPDFFDESRMRRFLLGYLDKASIPAEQCRVFPELMVETLIAETVVPIAATGSFGWYPGYGVLQMVRRKVEWLRQAAAQLREWLLD